MYSVWCCVTFYPEPFIHSFIYCLTSEICLCLHRQGGLLITINVYSTYSSSSTSSKGSTQPFPHSESNAIASGKAFRAETIVRWVGEICLLRSSPSSNEGVAECVERRNPLSRPAAAPSLARVHESRSRAPQWWCRSVSPAPARLIPSLFLERALRWC